MRRRKVRKPQQVSRVPYQFWPGTWVKLRTWPGFPLAGKVLRVRSLTGSITAPDQRRLVWWAHFDGGRVVEVAAVERPAWEDEIAAAREKADV